MQTTEEFDAEELERKRRMEQAARDLKVVVDVDAGPPPELTEDGALAAEKTPEK